MCRDRLTNSALDRRKLLKTLGSLGVSVVALGCGGQMVSNSGVTPASDSSGSTREVTGDGGGTACVESANETNGPFPADGSNSAGDGGGILDDVYAGSPIIRSNITSDTSNSTVIAGVPLTLTLTLQNTNNSCAVLSGYYIYIWHCTPNGQYSAYSGSGNAGAHSRNETYLRGIQATDSNGQVTFQTVYPGWYTGRAVHIHVEIYKSISGSSVKTTQIAFPMEINTVVQATSGYNGTSRLPSNSADGIFADGTSTEMAAVSGNTASGYTANLTLRVAA